MDLEKAQTLLKKFENISKRSPGPIPYSVRFNKNQGQLPSVLFSACFHGDEIGSLPGLLEGIKKIETGKIAYDGPLTFVLGNIEAIKIGKRFVDQDINRLFNRETKITHYESQRVHELMNVFDEAAVIMDFHQTIEPTPVPFFIVKNKKEGREFIEKLNVAPYLLFNDQTVSNTATTYNFRGGKISYTLELSQKGFCKGAEEKTLAVIERTLQILRGELTKRHPVKVLNSIYWEPFDHPKKILNSNVENFFKVKKGDQVGTQGDGSPLLIHSTGYIFLPKHPKRDKNGSVVGPLGASLFELFAEDTD